MKQAQQEINKINVEKKEYVDLWRASLVGMTRRDAALAQAEQAVHQQEEQGRSLQTGMRLARSANSLIQTSSLSRTDVSHSRANCFCVRHICSSFVFCLSLLPCRDRQYSPGHATGTREERQAYWHSVTHRGGDTLPGGSDRGQRQQVRHMRSCCCAIVGHTWIT